MGSVVKVQVLEKLWEAALLRDADYEHMYEESLSQSVIDNDRVNEDQDSVHHALEIVPGSQYYLLYSDYYLLLSMMGIYNEAYSYPGRIYMHMFSLQVIYVQGITSNPKNIKKLEKNYRSQEMYHLAETVDIRYKK